MPEQELLKLFTEKLLQWFDAGHARNLPWKQNKDPYRIWLSEIILQQTRVEQGLPYFLHFCERWPTLAHLAKATEDEVLKAWQGLGYYSRARRLLACAKQVQEQYDGHFPADYDALLALPGIGPYTAAAIASFAFDLPVPAIDGNAYRLLARFFGIEEIPISSAGKRAFRQIGEQLIPENRAADFNQAVMDFASAVCRPQKPRCDVCPLNTVCTARRENRVGELPRKKAAKIRSKRFFYYLFLHLPKGKTCIRRRPAGDIWQGLWEFPLIELPQPVKKREQLWQQPAWKALGLPANARLLQWHRLRKHLLTHQELYISLLELELDKLPDTLKKNFQVVNRENLPTFAWPKPLSILRAADKP